MIDRAHIGSGLPEVSIEVEKYPLRLFADAIGATSPLHHDEVAAKAAGYPSLLAPPTYVACLAVMADPDPGALLRLLDVDLAKILHAEQRIAYHRPICAGDRLRFRARIEDIYERKHGALEFVVISTDAVNERGEHVARTSTTMVVRN